MKFLIWVNGFPSNFFESSRGLWHGDLLFPLLFIFVVETHSKMLNRAITAAISLVVSGGASRGIMVISSLLFANDTILFSDTDAEQFLI